MTYFIGITGGSGSGKTLFSSKLKLFLLDTNTNTNTNNKVFILNMDTFYKGISQYNSTQLLNLKQKKLNYDDPELIDIDGLIKFLEKKTSQLPTYDFSKYDRTDKTTTVNLNEYDYIIIEGIFALYFDKLLNIYDITIFIDANDNIRKKRRIQRNIKSRIGPNGFTTVEFEEEYYNKFVIDSYKKYIEPTKQNADFVINGTKSFHHNDYDYNQIYSNILKACLKIQSTA
jgi:uridine kinase